MLHFNQHYPEIYIYVSKNISLNIINPILEKKHLVNNIICHHGWQTKRKTEQFTIVMLICPKNNTFIYVVMLKGTPPQSLQVFSRCTCSNTYFGIKNKVIKTYANNETDKLVQEYLM